MENYVGVIPLLLEQISKVLSDLSGETIVLSHTGNHCLADNGKLSIEIEEINLSSSVISKPTSSYPLDDDGFYRVNRIRLSNIILGDTQKGYPFSDEEIKILIKGVDTWAYFKN